MNAEALKKDAGEAAAALIGHGMAVGLGTGSTARWFIEALAARSLDVACVPTSEATARLAETLGLRLVTLDDVPALDIVVDGADEIAPDLSLIKGGGGALLREKLVWEGARRRVVIADAGKRVDRLGRFPLPVEVVPFGHGSTAARLSRALAAYGITGRPVLRVNAGQPAITDNGNLIYDIQCGAIADPASLAARIKAITGVVEHGIFAGLATEALLGTPAGVQRLVPP